MIRILITSLFLTGCTNMPTRYGDSVIIKSGPYKGQIGRLVGDCSGFEKYKVRIKWSKDVCIKVWDLEVI